MLHLSQMIEEANHAVTNIQVVYGKVLMDLMNRSDMTHEQKLVVIELFTPVVEAAKVAQSKFTYSVN